MLGALIVWWPASFWLQWTMAEGTVHTGCPAKFPTKPTEEWKNRKMYAIKQIKICAEYRDMLPRSRLDLSGIPALRPIGLNPGSWQTSLGLGSMSRYSAQILNCITHRDLVTQICASNLGHLFADKELSHFRYQVTTYTDLLLIGPVGIMPVNVYYDKTANVFH